MCECRSHSVGMSLLMSNVDTVNDILLLCRYHLHSFIALSSFQQQCQQISDPILGQIGLLLWNDEGVCSVHHKKSREKESLNYWEKQVVYEHQIGMVWKNCFSGQKCQTLRAHSVDKRKFPHQPNGAHTKNQTAKRNFVGKIWFNRMYVLRYVNQPQVVSVTHFWLSFSA